MMNTQIPPRKKITLEMSLKPFFQTDRDFIRQVCRRLFTQWSSLLEHTAEVSVLLWSADGSEILDYDGRMETEFEWAYFIGGANRCTDWDRTADPEGKGLHTTHYLYREHPAVMTYGTLKLIVETLREEGEKLLHKPVSVGATFDPGPEFALSDFKYRRHRETCVGESMGRKSMVCCYSVLNADDHPYAGYPDGIPDQTPFGTFFGRQSQLFLRDLGFDYLWLSNGFGFGTETWGVTGALLDGKRFYPERLNKVKKQILGFWEAFRKECSYPVETRGTNLTAGIDFASDGVCLDMLYQGDYDLLPPPNSPWAAMDGNFGLELAGYLSRVASLPGGDDDFLFRFYVHDPWWMNSPWLDRYGRCPHDIYLPLSVGRIGDDGRMHSPNRLNFLTVDNSLGEMPDVCPREIIPHLLEAYHTLPDEASPFVWVYPFREYFRSKRLSKPFFEDWFVCGAINEGIPVSTVISSELFCRQLQEDPGYLQGHILMVPVPAADAPMNQALLHFVDNGGKVILYGSLTGAAPELLKMLGLRLAEPVVGLMEAESLYERQRVAIHFDEVSTDGGAAEEELDGGCPKPLILLTNGKEHRVGAAIVNRDNGGSVLWVRGSDCSRLERDKSEFSMAAWLRNGLREWGYQWSFEKPDPKAPSPVVMMHRHEGALWFSGYMPDTTVKMKLRFPLGAPILTGEEALLVDSAALYSHPRAWRAECRLFVEQREGTISCRDIAPVSIEWERRILVTGLKDATVRILPRAEEREDIQLLVNSNYPFMVGDPVSVEKEESEFGPVWKLEGVTGELMISFARRRDVRELPEK